MMLCCFCAILFNFEACDPINICLIVWKASNEFHIFYSVIENSIFTLQCILEEAKKLCVILLSTGHAKLSINT
jgi:hypothetical protein